MIAEYQNGKTIRQVANENNIPYTTFHDKLNKVVKLRDRSLGKIRVRLQNSKELWYLIGVLFGDGSAYSYPHHQSKNARVYVIELSCKDREFTDEFSRCCRAIGLNPHRSIKSAKTFKQGFAWKARAYSKTFNQWYDKITYNQILNLPREFKIEFLRGIFDSEGCFYKPQNAAKITNTKIRFINLIKELLALLDFKVSIYYHTGGFCSAYDISLLGGKEKIREFLELINPTIERKKWREN